MWLRIAKCDWLTHVAQCSFLPFVSLHLQPLHSSDNRLNLFLAAGCFELYPAVFRKHEVQRGLISDLKERNNVNQKIRYWRTLIHLVCEICSWSPCCGTSPYVATTFRGEEKAYKSKGYQMIAYKKVGVCFFFSGVAIRFLVNKAIYTPLEFC